MTWILRLFRRRALKPMPVNVNCLAVHIAATSKLVRR